MKRALLLLLPVLLLAAGCQTRPTASAAATGTAAPRWTASAVRAEHPFGGYVVRNNVWGTGPGPQTIWAESAARWGVHADHPETEGVKSYWLAPKRRAAGSVKRRAISFTPPPAPTSPNSPPKVAVARRSPRAPGCSASI